ncbi:MAG: VanZ family protein [Eubacteriales bacterium]|nr:VanZ family protein [Eubacteriales bacterium]
MLLYYVLFVLPAVAAVSLVLYLPWGLAGRRRGGLAYHLPRYALVGYGLSLLYLTILWYYPNITFRPEYYFWNLRPFVWVTEVYDMGLRRMLEQLAMNVLMFVPLGLLLPVDFPRLRSLPRTALAVLGTTMAIEITQFFMGRSADIDDVIMNFAGGLLGWCLFRLLNCRPGRCWKKMLGE